MCCEYILWKTWNFEKQAPESTGFHLLSVNWKSLFSGSVKAKHDSLFDKSIDLGKFELLTHFPLWCHRRGSMKYIHSCLDLGRLRHWPEWTQPHQMWTPASCYLTDTHVNHNTFQQTITLQHFGFSRISFNNVRIWLKY